MKKLVSILFFTFLFFAFESEAQNDQNNQRGQGRRRRWEDIGPYISKDSVSKGKYTLIFINRDSAFAQNGDNIKKQMIDAFFKVYPKEAKRFNKKTARKVTFVIDQDYKGVAAASGQMIKYSPLWMLKNPNDIDVVTHEAFHIVQSYPRGAGPGWLTEGITDYVRYRYGVNNAAGNWSLPEFKPNHKYTDSYRITGRFLAWAENNVNKKIVNQLDAALRTKAYTPETWTKITGKTVDELWAEYAQNPKL